MDTAGAFSSILPIGAIIPWLLLALTVAAVALAVERSIATGRARIDVNRFLADARKALLANRSIREAIKVCEQYRGPVPSILKAGLLKYGEPREDLQRTMANASIFERGRLERFLPLLATIARVAPLLGFLGTAIGLIGTCDAVAARGVADAGLISASVREALLPAVGGLFLGALAHAVSGWLTSRVAKFTRDSETASNMLLETLGEMARSGVASDTSGAIESARGVATR